MAEFISSDTNIWIDFETISAIEVPFKLPYTYIMWEEAVNDEIKSPGNLRGRLIEEGLVPIKLSSEELWLAEKYNEKYFQISFYDAIALAVAKSRSIVLMTGDRRLRKAAEQEGVSILGTIGVLDRLRDGGLITQMEFRRLIQALCDVNGGVVRLPEDELLKRLN